MDYFKSRQNLRGIVLALGIACTASNAFAVSLATPPENAGANTAMAVQQKITVTGNVSDVLQVRWLEQPSRLRARQQVL